MCEMAGRGKKYLTKWDRKLTGSWRIGIGVEGGERWVGIQLPWIFPVGKVRDSPPSHIKHRSRDRDWLVQDIRKLVTVCGHQTLFTAQIFFAMSAIYYIYMYCKNINGGMNILLGDHPLWSLGSHSEAQVPFSTFDSSIILRIFGFRIMFDQSETSVLVKNKSSLSGK